ncbi:esterase [Agaricicola taiwanensis]|uniref:Esterase n=1 Tax=Agaricicola taiwanensis TaxID=591372 RepID=A0A8J3DWG6_9RHOB|nr:alpha/beta hydrolase [Agaricicola taiwanensis]GGE46322.1 esterase [Agaricicola taiwanensis]
MLHRLITLAAVMMFCVGCAGRPHGVLLPVSAEGLHTTKIDMLVATTRAPANPSELFSGERGTELAFADMTISIPPDAVRKAGEVQWPKRLPGDPARDFVVTRAEAVDKAGGIRSFRRMLAQQKRPRRVLLFVHGYNNVFEAAVYRFAQIIHDSGAEAVPVLFTWPSRGKLLAYTYDRESTNYSRDAFEETLQALARDPQVDEISILSHSMGNWLTLEGLRQMAIRDGHVAPKIKNVMLAAPDVDVDVFRTQIAEMGKTRPRFTLFVSRDDRALAFSRRVWGSTARLGAIDPEQEPYKTELERSGIAVLDLTKVKAGDSLHHGKFAESPEVVKLIGSRLLAGQDISDENIGLGDKIIEATTGAAASVGSAAGLVVAAPIAIVSPGTRRNYGDRTREFGGRLSHTARSTGSIITEPGL